MFKITWDKETGGILLNSRILPNTLGISPRPVFAEELDLLKLNQLENCESWSYPNCKEPLLWACNKQYFYKGELVFEVKDANLYDNPSVFLQPNASGLSLEPIDIEAMLAKNKDEMFLLESEAIEFIRDTYIMYSAANKSVAEVAANQLDFNALLNAQEKKLKKKLAIIKEECDSFDIVPLDVAQEQGKRIYHTTRVDRFLASFSGGKDSQVVLDLVTRAIPPYAFEVIYSDTGYELPPSLKLYDDVKEHYHKLYPSLKFSTAKNHKEVLDYWDQIGSPSDTHRWCCSIMKTAPLYRTIKIEGSNKQAKVLAFEGVRAEESTRRSNYGRIGKGVKHDVVINARPILNWNTAEIFLYLFKYNLPINPAYRQGMTRVGCLICPFSSEWNEHIANTHYTHHLSPFLARLENNAKKAGVRDISDYIKAGNWKRRASGNLIDQKSSINFTKTLPNFEAHIKNAVYDVETWLPTIGEYTIARTSNRILGELRFDKIIYKFTIELNQNKSGYVFTLLNATNPRLISLLKRVLYKTTYCISCEACEIECPTGALSVLPKVTIDKSKCIHCNKCLNFHDRGCVVADSLMLTIGNSMNTKTSIDRYKNFGLKEEWVDLFFASPSTFWESNHGLNPQYQVSSLKNWLKDAEIINDSNSLTELGNILSNLYMNRRELVWEIIWINLTYNSFIAKWYATHINSGVNFSGALMEEMIQIDCPVYKGKTVHNAVYQILRTLKESPIGTELNQYTQVNKNVATRGSYDYLSEEAAAYSIYRFAEAHKTRMLRMSDFYRDDADSGIYKEFQADKSILEKLLRTLNSANNRVLVAELNMGLDHITIREDLTPTKALELLTQ